MKRIAYAALVALSAALMSGCGKDMNNPVAPVANESNTRTSDQFSVERTRAEAGPLASNTFGFGVSRILFVHASPDAPAVDINLGIQPVARDLVFANNTPYRYTWSGPRRVLVNVANTSTNVINAMATLSPWTFYSVFATGTVADLKPLVLVDDLRSPARGKAHVRFVHLSPFLPDFFALLLRERGQKGIKVSPTTGVLPVKLHGMAQHEPCCLGSGHVGIVSEQQVQR